MDDLCLFCKISKGEKTSFIVYEDKNYLAFLDHRPLIPGHCLLIPKRHVDTLYDLSDRMIKPLFSLVKKIGKAVENAMESQGSFIAINNRVSQSIPHLHVHIVPRNPKDGLVGFFWPRKKYSSEKEMVEIQMKIKKFIDL